LPPSVRDAAQSLGILENEPGRRIAVCGPKDRRCWIRCASTRVVREFGIEGNEEFLLASMGIYVFNRDLIVRLLDNTHTDFGKHVIPGMIATQRVFSYVYQGYWEDIGTIRAFFEANLDFIAELPRFNFFDMSAPIFSRPRFLPGSKINGAQIDHALISDGCIINHARISQAIIGIRSLVGSGSELNRVILMGGDYYESHASISENELVGKPRIGIGQNTRIENAIIDKNARIGDNVVISPAGKPENVDHPLYYIRDGVVIIPKDGSIPHGMAI
jgi:glucose-1-phosphate adenylyltransferase